MQPSSKFNIFLKLESHLRNRQKQSHVIVYGDHAVQFFSYFFIPLNLTTHRKSSSYCCWCSLVRNACCDGNPHSLYLLNEFDIPSRGQYLSYYT